MARFVRAAVQAKRRVRRDAEESLAWPEVPAPRRVLDSCAVELIDEVLGEQ